MNKSNAVNNHKEALWNILQKIPRGKVTTYGVLGRLLNIHPRVVGRLLPQNPQLISTPCHRVVCHNGALGGYVHGPLKKQHLLAEEGVPCHEGRIALDAHLWNPNQ